MSVQDSEGLDHRDHSHGVVKIFGKPRVQPLEEAPKRTVFQSKRATPIESEPMVIPEAVQVFEEIAWPQANEPLMDAPLPASLQMEEPQMNIPVEHPLEAKVRELAALTEQSGYYAGEWTGASEPWGLLDGAPSGDIARLLREKAKEFAFLGYEHITPENIWSYLQNMKKKRPRYLHELVNTILALQPQAIVNSDLQSAYRNANESLEDILNDIN